MLSLNVLSKREFCNCPKKELIMQSIFVTGTDTDAGKTVAVAVLLSVLLNNNINAIPMKPVQTGCELNNGIWNIPDLEFVQMACGLSISHEEKELLCPYKFEPACSPHLAAKKANVTISLDKIIEAFGKLDNGHDMVITEGAGGIMVPIDSNTMMLDLMVRMNLPVVLATRPGLGTINHTLLSIRELRRAGLYVAGVIICETKPPLRDYIEVDNRKMIEQLGEVTILGDIPYVDNIENLIKSPDKFTVFCKQHLPKAFDILKEL